MMETPGKAHAWDLVGESYWNSGYYGGPAAEHQEEFLRLLRPGARTAVVGASTVSLSKTAQQAGAELHVLDFAPGILRAAGSWLGLAEERLHLVDVTRPIPARLTGTHALVLADRLVNRFSVADLPGGLGGLRDLTAPGGRLAVTVRFGWYERDRELHAALTPAEQERFWQPDRGEIDYTVLPDRELPLPSWGGITGALMREHLRTRGREARFGQDELLRVLDRLGGLECEDVIAAPDGTALLILRRVEHHGTS
ncbi:hypothetical protein [Streptomyces sp. NPDC051909]|uniref:hypothetical protein n=1 Tax=Streptomyces sp. NPDC051909 TaxID=3154944 RepID=UPI00342BF8DA